MKYPKTRYFAFSPSKENKDVRRTGLFDLDDLLGKHLVATAKMDGSNVQLTSERIAARNGCTASHPSFDFAKALHAQIKYHIPSHLVIFGEWLYAKHSIHYLDLESYLQIFAVYDKADHIWLSWEDVYQWAYRLGFSTVHQIFTIEGPYPRVGLEKIIVSEGNSYIENYGSEGLVVRNIEAFSAKNFKHNVAKYVRADHVTTDEHWSKQPIVRNLLRSS